MSSKRFDQSNKFGRVQKQFGPILNSFGLIEEKGMRFKLVCKFVAKCKLSRSVIKCENICKE